MTKHEYLRLRSFWLSRRTSSSHRPILQGKRTVKGAGKGYGVVLKSSTITASVGLESQHFQRMRRY